MILWCLNVFIECIEKCYHEKTWKNWNLIKFTLNGVFHLKSALALVKIIRGLNLLYIFYQ